MCSVKWIEQSMPAPGNIVYAVFHILYIDYSMYWSILSFGYSGSVFVYMCVQALDDIYPVDVDVLVLILYDQEPTTTEVYYFHGSDIENKADIKFYHLSIFTLCKNKPTLELAFNIHLHEVYKLCTKLMLLANKSQCMNLTTYTLYTAQLSTVQRIVTIHGSAQAQR